MNATVDRGVDHAADSIDTPALPGMPGKCDGCGGLFFDLALVVVADGPVKILETGETAADLCRVCRGGS